MKVCDAPRCERPRQSQASWARNPYCSFHYTRFNDTGDVALQPRPSAWDRFVDKVVVAASDCWLWTGGRAGRGDLYGQFWYGGTQGLAHRFSYETLVGPVPEGLELDHLCRVQHCVNPTHLEPVTPAVNIQRMRAALKGATS